jgi:hypothetical protein
VPAAPFKPLSLAGWITANALFLLVEGLAYFTLEFLNAEVLDARVAVKRPPFSVCGCTHN